MKSPFVSVIIPNYNHARFLEQRIESILCQSYNNFEVIILDDKSTDNSHEIIQKYRTNKKISHIVFNEENSGSTFKQWEKGFKLSSGDLIWIAESDDACAPTLLEVLTNCFIIDNDCVLAYCKTIKIDTLGIPFAEEGFNNSFHMKGIKFIKKYLYRHNFITNASSAIFNKNVLKNIDWSFTNYKGCGDWIFWVEIAKQGTVHYNNSPLNFFRIHKTNTTTKLIFQGKSERENLDAYIYMRNKGYIGFKEMFRARISHIYSVRYGKQKTFFDKDTKKAIAIHWKENSFIYTLVWLIHVFHSITGIQIIKR